MPAFILAIPVIGPIIRFLFSSIGMALIIAALITGGILYIRHDAKMDERARLNAETLRATIAELHRQREAAEAVANSERERAESRARNNIELRERLAEYEREIEAAKHKRAESKGGNPCDDSIDPAGRDSLLKLRGE